ncbi:MAG: 4-hydroxythreonine-4-phosphate dehydrogenase PdxA [Thermodesulfovibrionales bacterium]
MNRKRIAITMGDPGGVGPEIIVKALVSKEVRGNIVPIIIGNRSIMQDAVKLSDVDIEFEHDLSKSSEEDKEMVFLTDIDDIKEIKKGSATAEGGRTSAECIKKAVKMCTNNEADAMVTAPISKEAIHLAGHSWPGHTEMLAELTNTEKVGMMFVGESLKVILVTIHVPLQSVPALITEEKVYDTILLAEKACTMLSVDSPRIAVAGLNPHAGEGGLFGSEEEAQILPAIQRSQKEGHNVLGPFPPDVIFKKALDGGFDVVVAMYHDQGLIPFKMLYFDKGVNTTIGLPIIRTSPDHGTAYDIAWKGIADPSSMIEAILLAERMEI